MAWLQTLARALELLFFLLSWKKSSNEADAVKQKELANEAKAAILSGNSRDIDRVWAKLRT